MYQAMKMHSLHCVLPRIIAAFVLAVVLLVFSVGGVVKLLAGPQDLLTLGEQVQPGDYVTVDYSRLISEYVAISKGDETIEIYYILDIGDGTYLSLSAPSKYESKFERATSQSYDYYRNDSGVLNAMGMICGEVEALDEENLQAMSDWVIGSKLTGFDEEPYSGKLLAMDVALNHVNGKSSALTCVLFILGILSLIWLAVEIILVYKGFYYRQVRELLGDDAKAAQEWQEAESYGNARIGKDYAWYTEGAVTRVFRFIDAVWVYKQFDQRMTGKYKWPVSIFTRDMSYYELCVEKDSQRDRLISLLREHGGHFVAGYSQDNYDQFCNQFEAFCARADADDPDADAPLIKLPD